MLCYFLSLICWEWWGLTALTQIITRAQNVFSKTLRKKYRSFFWSLFCPYFIASVNQSKCIKIRTRKTPIKETFCSMKNIQKDKNFPSIDFLNSGYHFSVSKILQWPIPTLFQLIETFQTWSQCFPMNSTLHKIKCMYICITLNWSNSCSLCVLLWRIHWFLLR